MFAGKREIRDFGGPLRIAEMSGDMAQIGIYAFVWFMAAISLSLCLINLLPVPMLDGGHLLFYGIEAIRGKPLGEKAQDIWFPNRDGFGINAHGRCYLERSAPTVRSARFVNLSSSAVAGDEFGGRAIL